VISNSTSYLRKHWHGQQSLIVSFWVNLVLLRAIILGVESFLIHDLFENIFAFLVYIFIFDVMIYAWQVVGVLRSCDLNRSLFGSISETWGVHFGIVVSLVFTLSSVFGLIQNFSIERDEELLALVWEQERAAKYALALSEDGTYLHLTGSFELGITKKVAALLRQNPNVKGFVLASPGGNTFEGRGVAKVIREYGLNTFVLEDCFSACTLAFIAGATRSLGPNGRLGFHQYGLDADYQVPFVDIQDQQLADREFFQSQMIEHDFLDKVFKAPQSELWIPSTEELFEAGVIHKINEVPLKE